MSGLFHLTQFFQGPHMFSHVSVAVSAHQLSNRSVSDSLGAQGPQRSRPLSPSPPPGVCPSSCTCIGTSFLLWPSNIPLYGDPLGCSCTRQLMDICLVATLWAAMNNCCKHQYTSFSVAIFSVLLWTMFSYRPRGRIDKCYEDIKLLRFYFLIHFWPHWVFT